MSEAIEKLMKRSEEKGTENDERARTLLHLKLGYLPLNVVAAELGMSEQQVKALLKA